MAEPRRGEAADQRLHTIERGIGKRHPHRLRVNVAGERRTARGARGGNGKHARAAAHIQNAGRTPPLQNPVKGEEAALGRAMVACAEGGACVDRQGHTTRRPPVPVMRAMQEEASGSDGGQACERLAHPVLLGQGRNHAGSQ